MYNCDTWEQPHQEPKLGGGTQPTRENQISGQMDFLQIGPKVRKRTVVMLWFVRVWLGAEKQKLVCDATA